MHSQQIRQFSILLALIFLCGADSKAEEGVSTLYTKQLTTGARMEVVRSTRIETKLLIAAFNDESFKIADGMYHVSLRVTPRDGTPILLWTRILLNSTSVPDDNGLDVLDLDVFPDHVAIVTTEGKEICFWSVGLVYGESQCALIHQTDWTGASGLEHVDHKVIAASLQRTADGHRSIITISQVGQTVNHVTIYEQQGEDFEFPRPVRLKMISQVPADVGHTPPPTESTLKLLETKPTAPPPSETKSSKPSAKDPRQRQQRACGKHDR